MYPLPLFPFLIALALACLARAVSHDLKLFQSVTPPRGWDHIGRAPSSHIIQLRIALPQLRFLELERHLAEISDPSHARYGAHLSKEEVEELVAPHPSSVDAVYEWLSSHGIQREACYRSPAGDWVTVHVPVARAEKMLGTVRHSLAHPRPDWEWRVEYPRVCRNSVCGNMTGTGMSSCARPNIAYQRTSHSISSSSSRRRRSIVSKGSVRTSVSPPLLRLPLSQLTKKSLSLALP